MIDIFVAGVFLFVATHGAHASSSPGFRNASKCDSESRTSGRKRLRHHLQSCGWLDSFQRGFFSRVLSDLSLAFQACLCRGSRGLLLLLFLWREAELGA